MSSTSELHIQIQDELFNTIHQVEEGELSHLDALIKMRQNKAQAEKTIEIVKAFETDFHQQIANKADEYGGKYQGYEIKAVNGRKTFKFDGVPEVKEAEKSVKELKDKYQSAFENYQKGNQITEEVNGVLHWADADSFLHPFPEFTVGASYFTVKKAK